jgi:hypothetical protein
VNLDAVTAEAGAREDDSRRLVAPGRPDGLVQILDELRRHP